MTRLDDLRPTATARVLDAPLTAIAILANDALSPDASANKCRYLAGQASRRWLAEAQAATADMDYKDARDWLARAVWMQWRHPK